MVEPPPDAKNLSRVDRNEVLGHQLAKVCECGVDPPSFGVDVLRRQFVSRPKPPCRIPINKHNGVSHALQQAFRALAVKLRKIGDVTIARFPASYLNTSFGIYCVHRPAAAAQTFKSAPKRGSATNMLSQSFAIVEFWSRGSVPVKLQGAPLAVAG